MPRLGRRAPATTWAPSAPQAYCLGCFARMPATGSTVRCGQCGFLNIAADRRVYWNRNPRLRRVEVVLKVVSSLITIAGCFYLATQLPDTIARRSLLVVAGPLFLGIVTWKSISLLTQQSSLRMSLIWTLLLVLLGALFVRYLGPVGAATLVLGAVAVAGTTWWYTRWKKKRTGVDPMPDPNVFE